MASDQNTAQRTAAQEAWFPMLLLGPVLGLIGLALEGRASTIVLALAGMLVQAGLVGLAVRR